MNKEEKREIVETVSVRTRKTSRPQTEFHVLGRDKEDGESTTKRTRRKRKKREEKKKEERETKNKGKFTVRVPLAVVIAAPSAAAGDAASATRHRAARTCTTQRIIAGNIRDRGKRERDGRGGGGEDREKDGAG